MTDTRKSRVVVSFGKPDPDEVKIAKAAEFCREQMRKSAMAILECGRELALLKADLRADEQRWLTAFGEDRERRLTTDNPFPFGSRTADMLIQVHARLSAGTCVPASQLPSSWTTLRELAKLSDKQLEASKGKIHPMMTGSEASALRPKKKPKTRKPGEQTIEKAHQVYMRIPQDDFLRELIALMRDRGIAIDLVQSAWERSE